jgi:chitinase
MRKIITHHYYLLLITIILFCSQTFASSLSCIELKPHTGVWSPSITLKNLCGKDIDLRNGLLEFKSNHSIQGSYWGNFGALSYPSDTSIRSNSNQTDFLITLPFIFPNGSEWWKPVTKLSPNSSITVQFSGQPTTSISGLAFYPMSQPVIDKGKIYFHLPQKPSDVSTNPKFTISDGNSYNKTISNASWNSTYIVDAIPFGTYTINIEPISGTNATWVGSATPTEINLSTKEGSAVNLGYSQVLKTANLTFTLGAPPEEGIQQPVLKIKNLTSGQYLTDQTLEWNKSIQIPSFTLGHQYEFKIASLMGLTTSYEAIINPANVVTINSENQIVSVAFNPTALETSAINVSIQGLPPGKTVNVIATDNYDHVYTTNVGNGNHSIWALPFDRQYQVSADKFSINDQNYHAKINPNQFITTKNQSLSIAIDYEKQTNILRFSPYVDVTLGTITKWDPQSSSMQPIGLIDVVTQSKVKALHLAFVTANNGCNGTWAGYPVSTNETGFGVPVFKQLKQQGIALTIALGGLSGQYLAQACESKQDLVNAYEKIINAYNPDGLDFDVENALQSNNVQLDRMMQAIKDIKAKYPDIRISFTLPVLPSGLVPNLGENVIKRAAINGLNDYGVNIMAMDYGSYFSEKSMAEYAIDAATSTFNQLKAIYPNQEDAQLWHRIEVTPMIGLNDTIPLNFSLNDVETLKQFAKQKGLGMLSFWSITRDHPCDNTYVSITCSSINPVTNRKNQEYDYEYTSKFLNP